LNPSASIATQTTPLKIAGPFIGPSNGVTQRANCAGADSPAAPLCCFYSPPIS
jgi:hypothetical protein